MGRSIRRVICCLGILAIPADLVAGPPVKPPRPPESSHDGPRSGTRIDPNPNDDIAWVVGAVVVGGIAGLAGRIWRRTCPSREWAIVAGCGTGSLLGVAATSLFVAVWIPAGDRWPAAMFLGVPFLLFGTIMGVTGVLGGRTSVTVG